MESQIMYAFLVFVCLGCGIVGFIPDDLTIPVDDSIPRIRPLKRQIRHFEPGKTGQVTVIYQTTRPHDISIRWFRKSQDLPNSEIDHHLTIEGDTRYRVKYLAINDVRAVTLKVPDVALWEFPMSFVLVMTAGDPAVQYQLTTEIDEPSPFTISDDLDEIRWVALPPSPVSFSYHGYMSVTCVAVLDSESGKTDELNMYRVAFEKDKGRQRKGSIASNLERQLDTEVGRIQSTGIVHMHTHRKNYVEEAGDIITIGSHTELPLRYHRYEVTKIYHNASRNVEGAYACRMARANSDRSYASAWIREGHPHRRPSLELVPCENRDNVMTRPRRDQTYHYRVAMAMGRETCVICRAYGYPTPDLRLSKDGSDVQSGPKHDVNIHINVADGGLRELTLTLWQPMYSDAGSYVCHAHHDDHVETLRFKIDVE